MGADVDVCPDVSFLDFYIHAFFELSTCRDSSMSVGQIPFTAIAEYANIYNVDDFDEFLYVIRIMDNTFIGFNNDQRKHKKHNNSSKGNRG